MNAPADSGFEGATRPTEFASFEEFWPYYVSQHSNATCRALHFTGTTLAFACVAVSPVVPAALIAAPVVGYGLSWVGHFVFEKNKPATFRHPIYSLMGDWVMFTDVLRGRVRI